MDTFHDSLEGKQNKTLKNLEEIQDTVAFMNQVQSTYRLIDVLTIFLWNPYFSFATNLDRYS